MAHTQFSNDTAALVEADIQAQRLPSDFINTVKQFYWPLACQLNEKRRHDGCTIIGVQGSQGSGKSTCAVFIKTLLENEFNIKVHVASIDDFYLTLSERQLLSDTVHPLLLTRGVPGTHDTKMIEALFSNAKKATSFTHPTFNKAIDDRRPKQSWPELLGPFDIVILEGWCVGIPAQSPDMLKQPINALESTEDADLIWRSYVNEALSSSYQQIYSQLDLLVTLQAPSFDCVLQWRLLQEQKMIEALRQEGADTSAAMNTDQIVRFISHYQRLTEHALDVLPSKADVTLYLNDQHQFTRIVP